jgi:hypothetical protein
MGYSTGVYLYFGYVIPISDFPLEKQKEWIGKTISNVDKDLFNMVEKICNKNKSSTKKSRALLFEVSKNEDDFEDYDDEKYQSKIVDKSTTFFIGQKSDIEIEKGGWNHEFYHETFYSVADLETNKNEIKNRIDNFMNESCPFINLNSYSYGCLFVHTGG